MDTKVRLFGPAILYLAAFALGSASIFTRPMVFGALAAALCWAALLWGAERFRARHAP